MGISLILKSLSFKMIEVLPSGKFRLAVIPVDLKPLWFLQIRVGVLEAGGRFEELSKRHWEHSMHIHTVFFWLWRTAGSEQRNIFENGLKLLASDPNVISGNIGRPAPTDRYVVDNSYDYGLVLFFENIDAHNAYQVGDAHQTFLKDCADIWSRVQVYDIEKQ